MERDQATKVLAALWRKTAKEPSFLLREFKVHGVKDKVVGSVSRRAKCFEVVKGEITQSFDPETDGPDNCVWADCKLTDVCGRYKDAGGGSVLEKEIGEL